MTHHPRHLTPAPTGHAAVRFVREVYSYLHAGIERLLAIITRADRIHDLEAAARTARALIDLEADRRRDAEQRADAGAELAERLSLSIVAARALAARWEREDRAGDRAPLSKAAAAHALLEALEDGTR